MLNNGQWSGRTDDANISFGMLGTATLTANPTTLAPGASSTLTVSTSVDYGPSPYYVKIFDVTTGSEIKRCGSGDCVATVSFASESRHKYQAYLASYDATLPITGDYLDAGEQYVSWSSSGWTISLSENPTSGGVVAQANRDVGPTPYYITIFDAYTGVRMNSCASGNICSWTSGYSQRLIAFVSSNKTGYLPPEIQANSLEIFAGPVGPN